MAQHVGGRQLKSAARTFLEWRYGLDTSDEPGSGAAPRPSGGVDYAPSGWLALRTALHKREVSSDDVFVDLGSGKGRVVFQAALQYRFKRVIGVEVSAGLNAIARSNIELNRARLRTKEVELVTADALEWEIPRDLTVVYLFNPLLGDSFSRMTQRLIDFVDRGHRGLRLIYVNPTQHNRLLDTGRVHELPLPTGVLARISRVPPGEIRRYWIAPR